MFWISSEVLSGTLPGVFFYKIPTQVPMETSPEFPCEISLEVPPRIPPGVPLRLIGSFHFYIRGSSKIFF